MATPRLYQTPTLIHTLYLLIKKMAKFNALHGIKCGVTGLAKEVHRCRKTVQTHLKEAKKLGLAEEIGRGYKGKKYFKVTPQVMAWYRSGASEKLFITLLGVPGNYAPECPEITHLSTISSSSLHPSLKNERGATPPKNVHREHEKRRKETSFEEIAQNMLDEGLEPSLIAKVCEAVRTSKTPIASPERYMRKILQRLKTQSELKFAQIRERYSLFIPQWISDANKILYSVSNRFVWKWWDNKVKVTHRGHGEYKWFNITNPNSLHQIRTWTGAY